MLLEKELTLDAADGGRAETDEEKDVLRAPVRLRALDGRPYRPHG